MSRRNFLRLAGLAGAGSMVVSAAGCSSALTAGSLPGPAVNFEKDTEVLIIGTGGAGLWTAYVTTKAGIKTLLIDKAPSYGGDTMVAAGVMPIHGTKAQEMQGIQDMTPEAVWEATKDTTGKSWRVPELFKTMIINGVRAVNIWTEEMGVKWTKFDTGYTKHFHVVAPGMGKQNMLLDPLCQTVQKGGGEFMFETKAVSFIVDKDNRPVGVRTQNQVTGKFLDIKAKKIVIASGDWVDNQEMVSKYLPKWANIPLITTGTSGDGISMALPLGAALEKMDQYANITGDIDMSVCWGWYGSMLSVLPNGKRFWSEFEGHEVPDKAWNAGYRTYFNIIDDQVAKGTQSFSVEAIAKQGRLMSGNSIEELAEKMGVPPLTLAATFKNYNEMMAKGVDTEFGRKYYCTPLAPPLYAVMINPVRYKTNGGLQINANCEVLDHSGQVIPNLYAAGSVTSLPPDMNVVCAIGMHAGDQLVAVMKGKA